MVLSILTLSTTLIINTDPDPVNLDSIPELLIQRKMLYTNNKTYILLNFAPPPFRLRWERWQLICIS